MPQSRRAMEPPGTAGAPGAAGRPWEEAKAFYDNLAPKKKPKSVRTPEVPNRVELPTLDGKQRPLPGCPILAGCFPLCLISSGSPWGSLGALSPAGSLGFSWVPHLLWVLLWNPLGAPSPPTAPGSPWVSLFFLTPVSIQVLGEVLGRSRCPHSSMASLACLGPLQKRPQPLRVSLGSCSPPGCSGVPPGLTCPCGAVLCPVSRRSPVPRPRGPARGRWGGSGGAGGQPGDRIRVWGIGVSQGCSPPSQARLLQEIRGKACVI